LTDFRFIHAADIHLDSPLRGIERYEGAPVDAIRNATRAALTNLVDLALEMKVGFVLLAGDLYDGDWKDLNTGAFFIREMYRLREARIPVFLIAGNHDACNEMTKTLRLPDNVKFFSSTVPESEVIEDLDVVVHGQSFAGRRVAEDLSARYPDAIPGLFNIGLLHTSAMGFPEHEIYAPCSLDGLRSKGYQYWALGHIHKRQVLCDHPPIIFPGNIQGRHIRESGEKGCSLVHVDHGDTLIEECPLDVIRWFHVNVDATGAGTPDEVVDRLPDALSNLLQIHEEVLLAVRLHLVGTTDVDMTLRSDPERWITELRLKAGSVGENRVWIEKTLIETQSHPAPLDDKDFGSFLAVLGQCLNEIGSKGELPSGFMKPIQDLQRKILQDARDLEKDLSPDTPERVRETLADVRQILFGRLLPWKVN
jgi:DNA repair protein SbcD/Mre11